MTPDITANDNIFIGQGEQLREWAGWSHPFDSFAKWQEQIGLDKQSVRIERPIDAAFAQSVRVRQRDPDLQWLTRLQEGGSALALPLGASQTSGAWPVSPVNSRVAAQVPR